MANCPRCNTENEPGFAYCRECGAALAPVSQQTVPDAPAQGSKPTRVAERQAVPPTRVIGLEDAEDTTDRTRAFQVDRSQQRATLVRVVEGGKDGTPHPLDHASTTIGREEGDLRFPTDVFLSNRHARVFFDEARLFIEDLGGTNGTFIRLRGPQQLEFGDVIYVGRQLLRLDTAPVAGEDAKSASSGGDKTGMYGRPTSEFVGCLSLLLQDGEVGDRYLLDGQEVVLGREKGDIVFTRDQFISNGHAAVRYVDDKFFVEDLGSRNGTLLRLREPTELDEGDTVLVGQQLFRVQFE